jgi:hypothetical protein
VSTYEEGGVREEECAGYRDMNGTASIGFLRDTWRTWRMGEWERGRKLEGWRVGRDNL